jgi:hypothetical protein
METEAGKEITQNDINRKLFEEITNLGLETREGFRKINARFERFEEKMDTRMIRFEDNINLKMNWQLGVFGLFLTGVVGMMGVITKIIPIVPIPP